MNTKEITKKAIEEFQKLTGVKPVSARSLKGSMSQYIQFTIPVPHELLFTIFYVKKGFRGIKNLEFEYLGDDYKYPQRSVVCVDKGNLAL